MAILSPVQISALAQQYFGDLGSEIVSLMTRIALLESSGNTTAYNGEGLDDSHGLWQINTNPAANPQYASWDLTNPELNAQAAREILLRQGPTAWSTYQQAQGAPVTSNYNPVPVYPVPGGGTASEPVGPRSLAELAASMLTARGTPLSGATITSLDPNTSTVTLQRVIEGVPTTYTATYNPQTKTFSIASADGAAGGSETRMQVTERADGSLWSFNPSTGQATQIAAGLPKQANQQIVERSDGSLWSFNPATGQTTPIAGAVAGKPNFTPVFDERTGETFFVDPATGQRVSLGQTGFPSIDPEREFGEGIRQFDTRFGEDQRQFNVSTVEDQRQANQRDASNLAQARLSAATSGFQSVNQLAPQLGQLALDNAKFTAQLTQTPADYVARAFFSRGGQSPLPTVSMADLVNNLGSNIGQFNSVLGGFNVDPLNNPLFPQIGAGMINPFTTGANAPTSPYASPSFAPQLPGAPRPMQPPQGALLGTAPTAPTGFNAPSYLSPQGDPYSAESQERWSSGVDDGSIVLANPDPAQYQSIAQNADSLFQPDSGGQDFRFEVDANGTLQAIPMAFGGSTTAPLMMVGDSPSGKPTGNEELVMNPTNAPISVVPNDALSKSSFAARAPAPDGAMLGTAPAPALAPLLEMASPQQLTRSFAAPSLEMASPQQLTRSAAPAPPPLPSQASATALSSRFGDGSFSGPPPASDGMARTQPLPGRTVPRGFGFTPPALPAQASPQASMARYGGFAPQPRWPSSPLAFLDWQNTGMSRPSPANTGEQAFLSRFTRSANRQPAPTRPSIPRFGEGTDDMAAPRGREFYPYADDQVDITGVQSRGTEFVRQLIAAMKRGRSADEVMADWLPQPSQIPRYADGTDDWRSVYDQYQSLGYNLPAITGDGGMTTGSSPAPPATTNLTAPTSFYQTPTTAPTSNYQSPTSVPTQTVPLGMNFAAPQLPTQPTVTQEQLIDWAQRYSPPAVSSVLAGQSPETLRFGFPLPTPQLLNSLTPAEREAMRTRLAVEFNTGLDDVEHAVRLRFANSRERPRARYAVGA